MCTCHACLLLDGRAGLGALFCIAPALWYQLRFWCDVLQLEEAMIQQLDDHIVMLQSMGFSPYKKPFEDRLAKWDIQLNLVGSRAALPADGPAAAAP